MSSLQVNSLLAKIKSILIIVAVVIIGSIILFVSVGTMDMAPDNAIVFIDKIEKTYFAPPLMEEDDRDFLVVTSLGYVRDVGLKPATSEIAELTKNMPSEKVAFVDFKYDVFYLLPQDGYRNVYIESIAEAREKGYSPDERHRDWGGFIDDYDLLDKILALIGRKKSRWRENGEWNW